MDLLKFCLVVALPEPHMFGVLVLLSFLVLATSSSPAPVFSLSQFVAGGGFFFLHYSWTFLKQPVVQEGFWCREGEEGSLGSHNEGHVEEGTG